MASSCWSGPISTSPGGPRTRRASSWRQPPAADPVPDRPYRGSWESWERDSGDRRRPMPGVLDARSRNDAVRRLAAGPLDLLVVGGGITSAGTALDAASRGPRVGLVESRNLAAGTSSRSSKLIHGGLRYLEQGDFKLVREALRERDLLVTRLAPHLVRPVPFLYPLYRKVVE